MFDFEKMDKRQVIFGYIFLLSNRLQTVMDQGITELTSKQWFLMTMLGMFDEPPTLKQLASACDSSHQNIKQLVLKLEAKGFVYIETAPADRRAMQIIATPKWDQWNEENSPIANQFLDQMFGGLTAQEIEAMSAAQMNIYNTLGEMKEETI